MIDAISNIVILSAPLALASFGALTSEYAGRMAVFIDGIINLSAFLCYTFTILTNSVAAGVLLSCMGSVAFIFATSRLVECIHANQFLASLGINMLTGALVSVISVALFGTRGVLFSEQFVFPAFETRIATTIAAGAAVAAGTAFLFLTKYGLYIRITGSDSDVLTSRGVAVPHFRTAAWCVAALYAALAGCVLSFRLSSFVPNISSGRGWLALAAVFLGKRSCAGTLAAALVMSAGEYIAANMQNVFAHVSSPLLISLPYIVALLLILLMPGKNRDE
ncbi:MAG: ABC transporter permease [Treponema sp.]|nr:ABC transporter permease [Treponema sp.]